MLLKLNGAGRLCCFIERTDMRSLVSHGVPIAAILGAVMIVVLLGLLKYLTVRLLMDTRKRLR